MLHNGGITVYEVINIVFKGYPVPGCLEEVKNPPPPGLPKNTS